MNPYYHSLLTHLWESTLFGVACCLLILAFGKSSSFSRHLLAWASILKFLIPFSAFSATAEWIRDALASSSTADSQIIPYVGALSQTLQIDNWMEFYAGDDAPSFALPWEAITLALWNGGIVVLCFLWIQQYVRISSSINSGCSEASEDWQNLAKRVWEKSQRSMPRILICQDEDLLAGVFGFRRPAVIIPVSFDSEFTEAEREAFLRHEFQHIYKHDNLWLFVQKLIRNLFWIHPLVWWLDRQISAEREIMRDEEVIRKTENAKSYLNCLMKASKVNLPGRYATSVGIKGSPFARRVKAIVSNKSSRVMDWLSTIGSISAILVLTLFLSATLPIAELRADDNDYRADNDEISEERFALHQEIFELQRRLKNKETQLVKATHELASKAEEGIEISKSKYGSVDELHQAVAYLSERLAKRINKLGDDGVNDGLMRKAEIHYLGRLLDSDESDLSEERRESAIARLRKLRGVDDEPAISRSFRDDDNSPGLTKKEKERMRDIEEAFEASSDLALDLIYDSINDESSAAFEYLAGNVLSEHGEIEKAVSFYQVALDKFPNFRNAAKNLGVSLVKLENWAEAKEYLLKASSLGSKDGQTHGLLGYCYLNTNDSTTAEYHFRIARRKQRENDSWQQGLSLALRNQGKFGGELEARIDDDRRAEF